MDQKTSFILLIFTLLASCQNYVYKDYHEFKEQKWSQNKGISFEYKSENTEDKNQTYNLLLTLRYHVAIADELFQFKIRITAPSGKTEEKALSIPRTDGTGKLRSEELGDLGDIEEAFLKNYKFEESGTYKFEINHAMLMDEWGGILGVGIKVQKAN
ncbi:MAG: hypothetical protein NW226_11100 [Microscillaceae bacterium]|nr:hypothetical protein [Microscillaceae bacterium]